jgi:hypothetical protein
VYNVKIINRDEEKRLVTLPRFDLDDVDLQREAREAAERVSTQRVIRAGRDAWEAIGNAESFTAWKQIGAALAVGKAHALRALSPSSCMKTLPPSRRGAQR